MGSRRSASSPDKLDAQISSTLHAEKFDLLPTSGRVDGLSLYSARAPRAAGRSQSYARAGSAGLNAFPAIHREVTLPTMVEAGAGISPVGKHGFAKQGEVWNGSRISDAALAPPKPRHLASRTASPNWECTLQNPHRVTKRDGRCLRDQFRVPHALQGLFGRHSLKVLDLVATGMIFLDEVRKALGTDRAIDPNLAVFPTSRVWPMGFSWSSWIVQCTMLAACRRAHLRTCQVLAGHTPPPTVMSSTYALATDRRTTSCIFQSRATAFGSIWSQH